MNQEEFAAHCQAVGINIKKLLDLATDKTWKIDLLLEIWDAQYRCTVNSSPVPNFVGFTRYIELGRHEDFVARFGWDQYAVDFALEVLFYFQRKCFDYAKETVGITQLTVKDLNPDMTSTE